MNILDRDEQKCIQKRHYSTPFVFIFFFFFYIPHSLSLIYSFYQAPCGIIPSLFFSHATHSNVYTSLAWQRVFQRRARTPTRFRTHSLRLSHSYWTWNVPVGPVSKWVVNFAEICLSSSKEEIKHEWDFNTNVSSSFYFCRKAKPMWNVTINECRPEMQKFSNRKGHRMSSDSCPCTSVLAAETVKSELGAAAREWPHQD